MLANCSLLICALAATLLSVLVGVTSYELLVTPSGKERFVRPVGSSLVLTCELRSTGNQQIKLEWTSPDGETVSSSSGRVYTRGDDIKLVLHVESIVNDDAGRYTCFASNQTRRDKSLSVSLTTYVLGVRPTTERFTKPLGSSIVLTCEIQQEGDESNDVYVRWLNQKQNEITDTSGRVYVEVDGSSVRKLYVTTIQEKDAGSYTCEGVVDGAKSDRTVILTLFKDITFDHAPSPQHPRIYSPTWIMECIVSGEPRPDVSWRYNGRRISSRGRYKVVDKGLQITNVTESDNGDYTCRAEVEAEGRYDERRLSLIVHIPPVMKESVGRVEGVLRQQAVLTCQASGLPAPKYEFHKTGGVKIQPSARIEVDSEAGRLVFQSLEKEDQNSYSCTAINDVGSAKKDIELHVSVPPKIIEFNNVTQPEGGVARLTCKATGDPTPNITLFQYTSYGDLEQVILSAITERLELKSDAGRLEMTLTSLVVEDASLYSCQAVNSAGVDNRTAAVIVNYKPRFPMYHNAIIYAWAGKTLNISCHVHANPAPSINWLHNGIALSNNGSYSIYLNGLHSFLQVKVTESDEDWVYGNYSCQATNSMGSNSYPIQLLRASVPDIPQNIVIKESSPNHVILKVEPPADNSGLEVLGYRVQYEGLVYDFNTAGEQVDVSEVHQRNITADAALDEDIRLENLRPSTTYILRIGAKNEVGVGKLIERRVTTEGVREPYPIRVTSPHHAVKSYEYTITWDKPLTGGFPIISYDFRFRQVTVKEGSFELDQILTKWTERHIAENAKDPRLQYRLDGLSPNTYYETEIFASNKMGRSRDSNSFIFLTGHGDVEPSIHPVDASFGSTTVLIIVIIFFLVLLIAVDVTCYFANGCGLTMCICVHLCGHGVGEVGTSFKTNEKEVEEGESKEMLKQPDLSPKLEMAKSEETPDHTTRVSEESHLEQESPSVLMCEEEVKVPLEDELRPKNRRSVLSQGDERWKDIVQELESRQGLPGKKKPLPEDDEVETGKSERADEMVRDDDERIPLTLTNQRRSDFTDANH